MVVVVLQLAGGLGLVVVLVVLATYPSPVPDVVVATVAMVQLVVGMVMVMWLG